MNKLRSKKLAHYSAILALGLLLSYAESMLFPPVLPLPGIKLGLSNIAALLSLFIFGNLPCVAILILRCIVASFFGGGITSLIFSLCGALLSLSAMILTKKTGAFSIYGISIAGASAHSVGQIFAAALLFGSSSIFTYLPIMLIASIFTGAIIAFITHFLLTRLHMFKKQNLRL